MAVLGAVERGHRYGVDILNATGLAGGTVYPMLAKLERDGLLRSGWEAVPSDQRRPARRRYEMTDVGVSKLRETLSWLEGLVPAGSGRA